MKKILVALLALCLMLPLLAGCTNNSNPPADTTTGAPFGTTTPEPAADTTPAVETTPAETTPAVETTPAETTPAVTTPAETSKPSEKKELTGVVWHLGYVGSSTHSTSAYKINPAGGKYSYTDVIVIEKAGTEISFVDDNTNSDGDSNFASTAAFVISSWKKSGDDWVIDKSGMNIAGTGSATSAIATPGAGSVTYTYVTDKDNEAIRLCYRSGQSTTFTPAAFPTVYIRTGVTPSTAQIIDLPVDEYESWIENSKKSSYYNVLEGVSFSVIGDSYLAGDSLGVEHVWCTLLAEKYGMKYINDGRNGSTMSNYVTNKNPMVDRWASVVVGKPDIVIIEGGRNDYNQKVPIGTNDDTDTRTFKGAVRYMIEKVRSKNPDALIICMTVWNVDSVNAIGNNCQDYGKAMIEMCQLLNVPVLNAMDVSFSGVDMNDAAFRTKYCQKPTDYSHLNQEGHRMVLPKFEKFIAEQYEAHLAGKK